MRRRKTRRRVNEEDHVESLVAKLSEKGRKKGGNTIKDRNRGRRKKRRTR